MQESGRPKSLRRLSLVQTSCTATHWRIPKYKWNYLKTHNWVDTLTSTPNIRIKKVVSQFVNWLGLLSTTSCSLGRVTFFDEPTVNSVLWTALIFSLLLTNKSWNYLRNCFVWYLLILPTSLFHKTFYESGGVSARTYSTPPIVP